MSSKIFSLIVVAILGLAMTGCFGNGSDKSSAISKSNYGGDNYNGTADVGSVTRSKQASNLPNSNIKDRILFTTDSSELSPEAQMILNDQANWFRTNHDYNIVIEGHADERGTREYNIALGWRRAIITKRYLVSKGVATNRIKIISYGKERPVKVCPDISCWSQNRRAVTVLSN